VVDLLTDNIRELLVKTPPSRDVQNLRAAADREDRAASPVSLTRHRELEIIEL
jgi:hypothetical protein